MKERARESTRSAASQCTQLCLYRGLWEMYFVPMAGLLAPRSFISTHPLGLSARLNPPVLKGDRAYMGPPLAQGLSPIHFPPVPLNAPKPSGKYLHGVLVFV